MTTKSDEGPSPNATSSDATAYQKNWEFEQSIKKEEAGKIPLVCVQEDIESLYTEYKHGSEAYRNKIKKLAEKHSKIRRCRGDGNCFYRAFGFAWFERLMICNNKDLRQAALQSFAETKGLLGSMGYQLYVYEASYEEVEERLKAVCNGEHNQDTLLSMFQTDEISNHIVWYLRAITAAYLKKHREEYEPFIECGVEMDQYCSNFVEVMDQEADHIHVIALTKALKVPVEVAYMSGSETFDEVNFHEFYYEKEDDEKKESENNEEGKKNENENNEEKEKEKEKEKETIKIPTKPLTLKPLVLLYRPGHYDILYRNEF